MTRVLRIGDVVEVHTKFDGSWCAGFEVAAVVVGGYQLRRTHDRALLPETTSATDVRAPRLRTRWR